MNRLACSLVSLVFTVLALPASAQVFLSVDSPQPNTVVADSVGVSATIMGPVLRAEASIGNRSITLQNGQGQLSLVGEPAGTKLLTVTIYDTNNLPTAKTVPLVLDRPPVIVVDTPAFGQVVTPGTLAVSAHCTDDGATPCIVTSPDEFTIEPTAEGTAVSVTVTAVDSAGQTTTTAVPLFVESSPRLREVVRAAAGTVLDFDGTRALVRSADGLQASLWTATAGPTVVYSGVDPVERAQLLPQGAVITSRRAGNYAAKPSAWLWDGSSTARVGLDARVAGTWLATLQLSDPSAPVNETPGAVAAQKVVVRNLVTGVDTFETPPYHLATEIMQFEIARNGDLLWQQAILPWAVYTHRGTVTSPPVTSGRALSDVRIDEVHASGTYVTGSGQRVYLYGTEGQEDLCVATSLETRCAAPVLNAGWVGYGFKNSAAWMVTPPANRLFRRSPSGTIEELTGFDPRGVITAIAPTGEVVVSSVSRHYIGGGGTSTPVHVSSALGKPIYTDRWFILLGRSVFAVDGATAPLEGDAGLAPDSGSYSDAGVAPAPSLQDASVTSPSSADAGISPVWVDASPGGGSTLDAGVRAPDGENDSGCSLTGSSSAVPWSLWFAVFVPLMSRSRRRRS